MNNPNIQKSLDNLLYEQAINELAAVINPPETTAKMLNYPISTIGMDVPLLKACQAIAASLGISFNHQPLAHTSFRLEVKLDQLCRSSAFYWRKVRLAADWWKQDHGPLLGFSQEGTPVAIVPSKHGRFMIYNPAEGENLPLNRHSAQKVAREGYVFAPILLDKAIGLTDLLKTWLTCQNLRDLKLSLLIGCAWGLLGVLLPYLSGVLFNTVVPEAEHKQLFFLALAFFTIACSRASFRLARMNAFTRVQGRIDAASQTALMERMLRFPINFYRSYTAGDLADRANGISAFLRTISGITTDIVFSSLFSCFYFILLSFYSFELALFTIVFAGIQFCIVLFGNLYIYRQKQAFATQNGQLNGFVYQLLNAIGKLKTAGAEQRAFFHWAKRYAVTRKLSLRAMLTATAVNVLTALLSSGSLVGFYALISYTMMDTNHLSAGTFVAINAAFGAVQTAIIELSGSIASVSSVLPLFTRIRPVLKNIPEIRMASSIVPLLQGEIVLKEVNFSYDPHGPLVLNQITAQITPGKFIAFVGPTGSGKSTLLKLLLGFLPPTSGTITLDGIDIGMLDLPQIRRQFGVIMQNSELFPGSILHNILFSTDCTIDEAWEAARLAAVNDDIRKMPMQMYTMISERGSNLSGGQKQRLLLARALVKKPKILLLDEATSALDHRTQRQVMKNLERQAITRIVVAHRLSTIQNADQIFVLDKGRIVQSGTFEQLIHQGGMFQQLIEHQRVAGNSTHRTP